MSVTRFPGVTKAFASALDSGGGGASFVVVEDGEVILELHGGSDALDRTWTNETLVMCQSTTKGVMATALHLLVDDGVLDLDAPVAEYWPEFAVAGKHGVLVRHVLSHSAGLHKLRHRVHSVDEVYDYDAQVRGLELDAPAYTPGSRHGYHALTYGWLTGELLRRVSGISIQDFVRTRIAQPLGVDGLYIGCPVDQRPRVAPTRFRFGPLRSATLPPHSKKVTSDPRAMDVPVPAIGGFFTARSLASMYGMLADGGMWHGEKLLAAHTIDQARQVQSERRDIVLHLQLDWRLGYHGIRARGHGLVPDAFGHTGFGGSVAWADPRRGLACAFTCDSSRWPGDTRAPALYAALISDLDTGRAA